MLLFAYPEENFRNNAETLKNASTNTYKTIRRNIDIKIVKNKNCNNNYNY